MDPLEKRLNMLYKIRAKMEDGSGLIGGAQPKGKMTQEQKDIMRRGREERKNKINFFMNYGGMKKSDAIAKYDMEKKEKDKINKKERVKKERVKKERVKKEKIIYTPEQLLAQCIAMNGNPKIKCSGLGKGKRIKF